MWRWKTEHGWTRLQDRGFCHKVRSNTYLPQVLSTVPLTVTLFQFARSAVVMLFCRNPGPNNGLFNSRTNNWCKAGRIKSRPEQLWVVVEHMGAVVSVSVVIRLVLIDLLHCKSVMLNPSVSHVYKNRVQYWSCDITSESLHTGLRFLWWLMAVCQAV